MGPWTYLPLQEEELSPSLDNEQWRRRAVSGQCSPHRWHWPPAWCRPWQCPPSVSWQWSGHSTLGGEWTPAVKAEDRYCSWMIIVFMLNVLLTVSILTSLFVSFLSKWYLASFWFPNKVAIDFRSCSSMAAWTGNLLDNMYWGWSPLIAILLLHGVRMKLLEISQDTRLSEVYIRCSKAV